ncbi:MAG: hypothetical protein O6938_03630 [Gammaproteobacteria bacterium]|nr:hypothetical protein [Gammaproteobacteria bacterium]
MRYQTVVVLASATLFLLGGCGSSSTSPESPPDPSSGEKLFSADPDGDASSISDADMLSADIDAIFGGENAEPVSVKPGDTIDDVLNRAKSS